MLLAVEVYGPFRTNDCEELGLGLGDLDRGTFLLKAEVGLQDAERRKFAHEEEDEEGDAQLF